MGDVLYKRSFSQPYISPMPSHREADYVLREVNGYVCMYVCGNPLGGRSLAMKVLRQGYSTTGRVIRKMLQRLSTGVKNVNVGQPPTHLALS